VERSIAHNPKDGLHRFGVRACCRMMKPGNQSASSESEVGGTTNGANSGGCKHVWKGLDWNT
jgi:hypothetical protein